MALSLTALENDLKCGICKDTYKEPVILLCSHSFCKVCLEKYQVKGGAGKCPKCRKRSSLENPPINRALKKICKSFLKEKNRSTLPKLPESPGVLCSQHAETLNLFCVDDKKLVCGECVSQEHQMHNLCSIKKAVSDRKEWLQAPLEALKEKQTVVSSTMSELHKISMEIQSQVKQTEDQIKEEFKNLHHFLKLEEKARITALREEEKEKSWKITEKISKLTEVQNKLSTRVSIIDSFLTSDDASFLQNFEEEEKRAQYTVPDPELDSGALIDVAKHLGNLRYRVWEKMKDICPYFPVILDPNSASNIFTLSKDLTLVSHGLPQDLPNNPERFSVHPFVLGSEGFDSGTHSWEVEVGNSANWMIGVAKEPVKRKEKIESIPENGIWMIRFRNSIYSFNVINPPTNYQKIKVELDLSAGEVRFFNPDEDELLHSFKDISTEKVYPLFLAYDSSSLKILPATVSV
ncbi:hypothetical protein MHYP_G00104860 [Metynnis hypsauchen]